jgi:hypothetical protein
LNVTGFGPKAFDKRMRIVSLRRSGFTIERRVWFTALAPVLVAFGKGKFELWLGGPLCYTDRAEAQQIVDLMVRGQREEHRCDWR